MGLKVFISYPRELAGEAERWKTELEASLGERAVFVCHVSKPKLERAGRDNQRHTLRAKIQDADAFVAFLHRDYSRAAWCGWELTTALRTTKPVFIVNFDEVDVPASILQRIERVDSVETVLDRLRRPVAPRTPMVVDTVELYPAASLLESRFAPRLDARTRGLRELARAVGWFVGSIIVQVAMYLAGAAVLPDGMAMHLWALLGAATIAATIIGSLTLSNVASAISGVIALATGFVLTQVARSQVDLDHSAMVVGGAAMATFVVSLTLLVRDLVLKVPLGRRPIHEVPPPPSSRWGHATAGAGVVIVAALLVLGLAALDAVIDASNEPDAIRRMFLMGQAAGTVPVKLGIGIGALAGLAIAASVFRRVLRNYRSTAPGRVVIALAWAAGALLLATLAGWKTGCWIQNHVVNAPPDQVPESISAIGGAYAGAQIGLLAAVAISVPMAMGFGLSRWQESLWGLAGVALTIAVIAWKATLLPFGQLSDAIPVEIALGAAAGLVPVAIARTLASLRGGVVLSLAVSIAAHAIVLVVLGPSTPKAFAWAPEPPQQPLRAVHVSSDAGPTMSVAKPPAAVPEKAQPAAPAVAHDDAMRAPSTGVVTPTAPQPTASTFGNSREVATATPQHTATTPPARSAPAAPAAESAEKPSTSPSATDDTATTPVAATVPTEPAESPPTTTPATALPAPGTPPDATPAMTTPAEPPAPTPAVETSAAAPAVTVPAAVTAATAQTAVSATETPAGTPGTAVTAGPGTGPGATSPPASNTGSGRRGSATDGSGADPGSAVPGAPDHPSPPPPQPPARGIVIASASYGKNCGAPPGNVTAKVMSLCAGKTTCPFVANNDQFGDPVPYCQKDFLAEWRCGDATFRTAPVMPRDREGYPITLSCPAP